MINTETKIEGDNILNKEDIVLKIDYLSFVLNFIGANIVIWLFISRLQIIYEIGILLCYSIFELITEVKEIVITKDAVTYKLPIIKKEWTVIYGDFTSVTMKLIGFNRRGEYMDLDVKYYDTAKQKKNNFSFPIQDSATAKKLCRHFLSKGIKITTNDEDLQAIINYEIRKNKPQSTQ